MAQSAAVTAAREEAPASQSFADSQLHHETLQAALDRPVRPRSLPWHSGALGAVLLTLAVLVVLLLRWLAASPQIEAVWRGNASGAVELVSSASAPLQALAGARLLAVAGADGARIAIVNDEALLRSPRWTVRDAQRERIVATQQRLAAALTRGPVELYFDDGRQLTVEPVPRGLAGLGAPFWLLSTLALGLFLMSAAMVLVRPRLSTWLYALMCTSQACSLFAMAIECVPGLLLPPGYAARGLAVRSALDLTVAASALHISAIYPLRLPHGRWFAGAGWVACAALAAAIAAGVVPGVWWWTRASRWPAACSRSACCRGRTGSSATPMRC